MEYFSYYYKRKQRAIIQYVLGHFPDIPKENIVMVGDRFHDINGAIENNIDSIGVLYGYGSQKELQQSGATHFMNSIEDLRRFFDTI